MLMMPLLHLAIKDVPVAAIPTALADPVRVSLYAELAAHRYQRNCNAGKKLSALPSRSLRSRSTFVCCAKAGLMKEDATPSKCVTSPGVEIDSRYPGLLPFIARLTGSGGGREETSRPARA